MRTKYSKGIVDTEENKRMGIPPIGDGGNGTWTAQHNQRKEILILWTRDEKRRRLSGGRNRARHVNPKIKESNRPTLLSLIHREQENIVIVIVISKLLKR